jgi:glycosyltransferase involved in cell wall biosynthesis
VRRHPTRWAEPFASRPAAEDAAGLVSVVVPIYNGGALLARAIESVRTQTYERLELILVDVGSTDDSLARARCFAAVDDRIRVLTISNSGGPARPRNHAIEHSSGEFVAYLDQDDWWFPDKLHKQLALFGEGDFGLVYSDAVYLDDSSEESGLLMSELSYYRSRTGPMPHGMVVRDVIRSNFVTQCTLVVRTEWIRRTGPMNESARGVDCYDHLLRLALAGASFGAVREALAVHDRQRASLSRDQVSAWEHSLPFFRELAREHPAWSDEWTPRLGEYERALRRAYVGEARNRGAGLGSRIDAASRLLRVHPSRNDLWRVAKSFGPRPRHLTGASGTA